MNIFNLSSMKELIFCVIFISLQSGKVSGYTAFTIRTRKTNSLPIVDFMPKDYGKDAQQFGFEAGPVCFR